MNPEDRATQDAAKLLLNCRRVLFITGAGLSADSGLPTYRGVGGLYDSGPTSEGIPIEEALSGETFRRNPAVTWKYLSQIERNCRPAVFNRGHQVIAEIEKHIEHVWVLTQNVDGFHAAAGSTHVTEIHGNLHRLFCAACGHRFQIKDFSQLTIPPVCKSCGGPARPDVVLFGEMLDPEALQIFYDECRKGFDACFSIGTSSVFSYIQEPIFLMKSHHKPTVEINPAETAVSDVVDIKIRDGAAHALGLILDEYLKNHPGKIKGTC
jgi:NAD-dependent deacetylase